MLKDSKISRVNFLLKNYRPKCDFCGELCTLDWYITKDNDFDNIIHQKEIKEKKNSTKCTNSSRTKFISQNPFSNRTK